MYNPGQPPGAYQPSYGSYQPSSYSQDDKLGAKAVKDPLLHVVRCVMRGDQRSGRVGAATKHCWARAMASASDWQQSRRAVALINVGPHLGAGAERARES